MKRNNKQHFIHQLIVMTLLSALIISITVASFMPNQSAEAAAVEALPAASFTAGSALTVNETAGVVNISVSLSTTSTNNVTVSYNTYDGTGTAGNDYLNTSGSLTINAGSTANTFPVSIVNNTTYNTPNHFFYIQLSNPVSATLGTNSLLKVTITNDDAAPVPTSTPGGTIYVDSYEPNNSLSQAYAIAANQVGGTAQKVCSITFWPLGDVDYFKFRGKPRSVYTIHTLDLSAGLDTYMKVYNTEGSLIDSNDDADVGNRQSEVEITADVDGYYYIHITNQDPSDSTGKTYCLQVDEQLPPTPPPAMPTGADACEYNSTVATACLMGDGETKKLNFIPVYGSEQDTDMFRLWVKPSIKYTCETSNLSLYADTNIILYDQNGDPFIPWIGNDDREIGDRSSIVEYYSTYTGWLYIQVGPVNPPLYEEASLHTYELTCVSDASTPTPTATATTAYVPPSSGGTGGGSGSAVSTPTPPSTTPTPSTYPTPTPIDISSLLPTTAPPPIVVFQPLPTAVPPSGSASLISTVNVTAFYDANNDFTPAMDEGINNIAVMLFDNSTGELTAFGYTNDAGMVRFDSVATAGTLRVTVPFLNYTQIVTNDTSDILIRVAPAAMPGGIP